MTTWNVRDPLGSLRQDALFGARQLLVARSFAIAAVVTLAIGIGATTAVFSVVEAVVLRPFPFPDAGRVVDPHPVRDGVPLVTSSNLEFAAWRALPHTFDAVVATQPGASFIVTRGDAPEVVTGTRSTSALTQVLGVAPELGRGFANADDQPGAPHVVILSHRMWVREYSADRRVLGKQLRLDGDSYAIIGVMPASLDAVSFGAELWVPLALSSTDLLDFKSRSLLLVARLAPGVSASQATAAVDASEQILARQNPLWGSGYSGLVTLYSSDVVGNLRTRLFLLLGAVSLVFLIACVNVANLSLARATARVREMGIRTALGADRARLVQQLVTESGVLCAVAGTAGIALAFGLVKGIVATSPPGVPRLDEARIDGPVLLGAFVAAGFCSLVVGVLTGMRVADSAVEATLREGGRGTSQSRARDKARQALVVTELALAMALLTGAGLLIRTAWEISHVNPGFDSDHVLTAQVVLPPARYPDIASGLEAYRAIREGVDHTAGVQSAALTSTLPLAISTRAGIGPEGRPMIDGERLIAAVRTVTPNYFATMKIRLRAGRDFTETDKADAPGVAIINETLAKRFWPGENAVGKRMEGMDPSHTHFMEVVGVIADPRDVALDQQQPDPEFYIPIEQTPPPLWTGLQGSLTIVARTASDPATMEAGIRQAVGGVDPSLPIANVATMESLVTTSRATARFNTLLLSVLSAIALVLASVGVYGVIAYSAAQRTREIGLRMALGATPAAIASLVGRDALAPIAVGATLGAVLSVLTTRLLREQLYGVSPGDPLTILAIAALLMVVSSLAASIPTWRAVRISPMTALAA
jgi:putative ABC transport system permease protein